MPYGTAGLFRSCRNLANASDESIRVGTIETIETFQNIQMGQMAAIKANVICAGHSWDSINWKTNRLVGGYEQVEREGNNHQINQGRRQYHQGSRVQHVRKQTDSQRGMLTKEFLLKRRFPFRPGVSKLVLFFANDALQLVFQNRCLL